LQGKHSLESVNLRVIISSSLNLSYIELFGICYVSNSEDFHFLSLAGTQN